MAEQAWALSEWFDALVDLPAELQNARLLQAPESLRETLRKLLLADQRSRSEHADPLGSACESLARSVLESNFFGSGERQIGPYRILRELGSGGMGTVLLAERADGLYAQHVAIKLIRGFPTEEVKRRLRLERQILAQLDHPNIARLLDGGETNDGQPYVVMDFIDGVSVLDHIATRRLDLKARLALFDQIAAAVQHAHERLVIHRDLKPGNVLVRNDGVPKLLDFGIAKLLDVTEDAATGLRQTSTRVWTPGYASPEQERGELVTTASDVFGLAILLREMLCGERLPGQLSALPAGFEACTLDRDLRDILAAAAARDVAARYPTVEALRSDLLRWREGRTVRVASRSGAYRLQKFVVRHRWAVSAAILVGMLTVTGLIVLESARSRAVLAERDAEHARDLAKQDAESAKSALRLLTDTLVSVAPEQSMSKSVSVQTLLDALDHRVDSQLANQPQLRQFTQVLLGQMYLSMSNPVRASALLEQGLQGAQPNSVEDALVLADAYDSLASAQCAQEKGDAALTSTQRSSALREQYAADDLAQQLRGQHALGFGQYCTGEWERAVEMWEASNQRAQLLSPSPVDLLIDNHRMLAGVKVHWGQFAEALMHAEAALDLSQQTARQGSPVHIALLRHKAEALAGLNQLPQALQVLDQALGFLDKVFEPDTHQRMLILNVRGTVLNDAGRFREALVDFDTILAINRKLGLGAGDLAKSLGNIATVRESAGDYPAALQAFDEALAIERSRGDADARDIRTLQVNRARTLGQAGHFVQARESLLALQMQVASDGDTSALDRAFIDWQLAVLSCNARWADQAALFLPRALAGFQSVLPEGHVVFAYVARYEAMLLMMRGEVSEALGRVDVALTALSAAPGREFDVAIAQIDKAAILYQLQRRQEAATVLLQALPMLRSAVLPAQRDRARAERMANDWGIAAGA